ncbi:hypothetical protein N658DRAFT_499846 [Parathielavia hyrcaniae]|uniref:Uncharacterized protein n=1 Tax=Parathielavia hyrcaniae TaxID=113614 RepID=A0AAN6PU28_9PEZI|nr:hypothetical protein N658DRAFT_499846 [Parathielavia hyrcaniae]
MEEDYEIPLIRIRHDDVDTKDNSVWVLRKVFNGKYATHIPWAVLQEEARGAFNWLVNHEGFNGFVTTNPQLKDMACLVMALHVRRPGGGVIYFGTIGRGKRAEEMALRKTASARAPVWWHAIGDAPPNRIHCENVCWYGFERYNRNLPDNSPEKISFGPTTSGGHIQIDPATKAPLGKMRAAIWGIRSYKNPMYRRDGLQQPCNGHDSQNPDSQNPKIPPCIEVLDLVGVEYCTPTKLHQEAQEAAKANQAAGGSGAGAGRGQGGPGQAPPGQGGQGGYSGYPAPFQGGSGGAQFGQGNIGGGHNTTHSNHSGDYYSYDLCQQMGQLSMGSARPKLSPRNVLAAIHRVGKGETDEEGHPVYIGQVPRPDPKEKGKSILVLERVIVNAYGTPDEPSTSKDHKSKRAAALYAIARGLYKGKRRIANIDDYNELTAYEAAQRPSSSGSGGSGGSGEYTTRPGSRGGGGDYSSASAQPRTTAYDTQQPPAASQGSAPAQKTPVPPSKVNYKTNGGYYIKKVSQSDPEKEYQLHYSDSKKKFFVVKTVSSKSGKTKEEIYLTPAS